MRRPARLPWQLRDKHMLAQHDGNVRVVRVIVSVQ
jgi:hypothetical protein